MERVIQQVNKIWKPPPLLKISEWSDKYRKLSPEASAMPGSWRTSVAPFQQEIMDVFNDPKIETVVFMKSAQVGATEMLNNIVGFYVDQEPSTILVLQPTLSMAQTWSKDRLAPMLRDSPKLKDKVKDPRSKDANNTVLHKAFPGGHLTIVGSNSAAGLASRPIRIVLADEVDRYETTKEGDAISLATKRTATFFNRKIFITSTPTTKGLSRIEQAYESSDQRRYYVPCPHCKHMQTLKWKNLIWDDNDPFSAIYTCEECGSAIEENKKPWMLARGEWRKGLETKKTAGFHINELYSVWRTWAQMVEDFLEAKKNPEMLRVFVNTSLGETWEDQGESIESDSLLNRRENYDESTIPDSVLLLTAGVDTQKDRLEVQVIGWSHNYEAFVVEYRIFWGDPGAGLVWQELDEYLVTRFTTESGRILPISATCIDSGGHFTQQVYSYTKPRQNRRIFAVKGQSQAGKPIVGRPTFVGKMKNVLYPVGSDTAKEFIFSRLQSDKDAFIHFPITLDEEYFKSLTAEKRVTKYFRGQKRLEWKQIRDRNEALDTFVYALAGVYILQPNFDRIEANIEAKQSSYEIEQHQEQPKNDVGADLQQKRKNLRQRPRYNQNYINSWK